MTQQWAIRPTPVDSRASANGASSLGPLSILSGVVAYYDSSISQGTSTSWSDISGNGHNLSGAGLTANASGGPNAGPYMSAAGAGHLTAAFTLNQPTEIFILANWNWTTAGTAQGLFDGGVENGGKLEINTLSDNKMILYAGAFAESTGTFSTLVGWKNYDVQWNSVGNATQLSLSGTTVIPGSSAAGPNNMSGISLFSEQNGSDPATAGIALCVVCNQIQSAGARASMLAYMSSRGGV